MDFLKKCKAIRHYFIIPEFHGSESEVSAQAEFVKDIVEQHGGQFMLLFIIEAPL